ncbi:MAG: TonB C-terminal domain-containing protein [Bdellovibrionota bacterium]
MPDFKKSLGLSLAIHCVILSLFLIKFIFFSEPFIDLSQSINVSIGDFEDAQKLPDKIESEQSEDSKLPPKEVEPTTRPAIEKDKTIKTKDVSKTEDLDLKKIKAKQKASLDKLKKNSALEKIKQDLKKDSIAKLKSESKKSGKPTNSRRIIAAGSALAGLDKLQANNYLAVLDQSVKQHWALPQWLMNKPFKAQLLVKFNVQGQILLLKIISSSGNSSYDEYCLAAVEKAAPFPVVPEKLTEKFAVDGVVIGFPE